MKHIKIISSLLLTLWVEAATSAQTSQEIRQVQSLAATCANCHGTNGKTLEGSYIRGLAGLPSAFIIEQMKAFKTGSRPSTVMQQLAKGFSDRQIEQIAVYFAAQN